MVDWDERYRKRNGPLYGGEPNEYVRQIAARSDFAARSALMLADGDGRNGRWLARQSLAVTAVDISSVATERATIADAAAGVRIERITADVGSWAPAAGETFDAAFLIYLHCDAPTRNHALFVAASGLAPGGWLVAEGFAKAQAARDGMGPGDPALLYSCEELIAAAPGLDVIEALEGRVRLREGQGHVGEAMVVRVALRKPRV